MTVVAANPAATTVASSVPSDQPILPVKATPTQVCTNNLTFLSDVTIPDGTLIPASATLDKRWQVKNSGSCNWDQGYSLKLVSGDPLGVAPTQALFPARKGSQATLRIQFTAPKDPGIYRSAWQAAGPDGQAFGDTIFIQIEVKP
jgi:hypothetical protein